MARRKTSLRPSRLQKVCALAGLVVTCGVVAILAASALSDASPPDLSIRVEAVRRGAEAWRVEARVTNEGDLTAAAVQIEGQTGAERAEAVLDYVPGHGSRTVTLVFGGHERPRPRLRGSGWSSP